MNKFACPMCHHELIRYPDRYSNRKVLTCRTLNCMLQSLGMTWELDGEASPSHTPNIQEYKRATPNRGKAILIEEKKEESPLESGYSKLANYLINSVNDTRKQIEDFNAGLRPPDAVMTEGEGDYAYHYGFWRVPNGILKLRKMNNGLYSPWDGRMEISECEVATIARLALKDQIYAAK